MVQPVNTVPIRCPECSRDPNLRARLLAEVVVTPGGYDVWTVRRHRGERVHRDPDTGEAILRPEGTYRWRAEPDEHLRCGRKHRGQPGGVTLDTATIGAALSRAGGPTDLPRIVIEPDNPGVYPERTESYAELMRERPDADP